MPTAKTYTNWKITGEVFCEEGGKAYVNVINPKTQKVKKVRWYSDREYSKMYNEPYIIRFNARVAWGFGSQGYVTIFNGDKEAIKNYFVSHPRIGRYNTVLQWFVPSDLSVPEKELTAIGVSPVTLPWDMVGEDDTMIKSFNEVQNIVENLIGKETNPYDPFEMR